MRKYIYKTIITLLLFTMIIGFKNVSAKSNFITVNNTQDKYTLDITIRNFKYEIYDCAYVGQKLSQLQPMCKVRLGNEIIYGYFEWENKDYVLVDGSQNINLIFNSYLGEKTIFVITINPMILEIKPEPKHMYFIDNNDYIYERYIGTPLEDIVPIYKFWSIDVKNIEGTMEYSNYEDLSLGYHEIGWRFTPFDTDYNPMEGIYKVKIIPKPIKETEGDIIEDTTTPSLTATTIQLDDKTAYDINLNDKVLGSTYLWSTDGTEIIEVNPKNGKIKAKKEGNAKVTCEITLPDGNVNTLESLVTVGYDENAPLLTETTLDLEVGNKFDINLENKIAKSKYRWISSDRNIVKVNSSNGKITAVGVGEAYVTCIITVPETNQVIVLKCDIIVTE